MNTTHTSDSSSADNFPAATSPVGFIGYGAMARRMGAHLRANGHRIVAYVPSGRTSDEAATLLPTPRAVGEAADIVIICVPNDQALASSSYGDEGVLSGLRSGGLLINTSTVSPEATQTLVAAGARHGITVLDAPMSGSTPEAEKGELVMLVGGSAADLERARPVLACFSKSIVHAGPAGAGTRIKLVINGIMGATLDIIAEGVSYGLCAGLDRDVLYNTLQQVAVISPHHKRKLNAAQTCDFSPQFPTRLMSKDMNLLTNAGTTVGAFMPGMAVAAQALALSNRRHADEDYSALFGALEHSIVQTKETTKET